MKLKDFLLSNHTLLAEHICIVLVFICLCGAFLSLCGASKSLIRQSKEQMMKNDYCPPPSYEIIVNNIEKLKVRLSEIEFAITNGTSDIRLYAQLISTNLVRIPCTCGYCRPSEGIAVPEHVNALGYDTVLQVSTNYLPIVRKP